MDAIVIAGGLPQADDPLFPYSRGKPKALLDICGKPMVQWVLDALDGSALVERVVLIGLTKENGVASQKVIAFLADQGSMLDNIRVGAKEVLIHNPDSKYMLIVSSDIPGITPESVDWIVRSAIRTDHDAYYNVIAREVMEARYPGSRRSYARLRDVEVCGGDINVVRTSKVVEEDELWERIVDSRKNVFKQAALIGYGTLILLMLRLLTLEQGVRRVTRRLRLTGRAILCPYAEAGMDVDKPHQLEIMRADLANQAVLTNRADAT